MSRRLGYEIVYLPLCEVADTPFHIQGDDLFAVDYIFFHILMAVSVLSVVGDMSSDER